jgi:hypothetical protein
MALYRSKPIEVDAMQYTGSNDQTVLTWAKQGLRPIELQSIGLRLSHAAGRLIATTAQGEPVPLGDGEWVIRESSRPDRFYSCDPDVFAIRYEPA